jgi:predicted ATPase/DNA-binding CsgD family transcriptional regulator
VGGAEQTGTVTISDREAEVLAAVGERLTNAEIADRLYISVRTVESHVSSLLRKLGAADRRELADTARARAAEAATAEPAPPPAARVTGARLPVALTTFVGRAAERTALAEALRGNRLVTALGPGGVGKTRLAAEVVAEGADGLPDQAWFVDLVPVTDPVMVFAAVAGALGIGELQGGASREAVLAWLAARDVVLVLDNCEHVLAGAADCIDTVLRSAPGVRVLATSRTRLLLPYETVFEVPGLSVDDVDGVVTGDAVTLFIERATTTGATLDDAERARVAAICRRLDGMALAIELAAARVPALGLDGLEAGLDERLALLEAGPRTDDRHRSLRATLDWSCDLLPEGDRVLLRQVSVFAAAFTADAAIEVVDAAALNPIAVRGGLGRLVDHSLLVSAQVQGGTRYRMQETVRQYGAEELERTGELEPTRRRHVAWSLETAEELRPTEVDHRWRETFDRVVDDLRSAARWAGGRGGPDQQLAHRLELALGDLLFQRGRPADAEQRYRAAARLAPDPATTVDVLRLAAGAAACRHAGNEFLELSRQAADTALSIGDRAGAALDLAVSASIMYRAPGIMAVRPAEEDAPALIAEAEALVDSDPLVDAAVSCARAFGSIEVEAESQRLADLAVELAERSGNPWLESAALDQRSALHLAEGDLAGALADIRRRLAFHAVMPIDARTGFEISDGLNMASEVHLTVGDIEGARRYADALASLPFHREEGHLATARRLKVDAMAGRFDDVLELADRFRAGWVDAGRPVASNLSPGPGAVAMVHGILGDEETRAEWLGMTAEIGSTIPDLFAWTSGWPPVYDAIVLLHHGDATGALERFPVPPDGLRTWYNGMWRPWYAALWVEAAVLAGAPDARERLAPGRSHAEANPIAMAMIDRAEALLTGELAALEGIAQRFDDLAIPYQADRTVSLGAAERQRSERPG